MNWLVVMELSLLKAAMPPVVALCGKPRDAKNSLASWYRLPGTCNSPVLLSILALKSDPTSAV